MSFAFAHCIPRLVQVLDGKEVCVLAQKDYPKTLNKALVEKLVHSLGGWGHYSLAALAYTRIS